VFQVLSRLGEVDREEMYCVFNMGVGLILVVPAASVSAVLAKTAGLGDQCWQIGEMVAEKSGEPEVEYVD
jgi:phosphoribosylformylglycinamidine cyclo-ligase